MHDSRRIRKICLCQPKMRINPQAQPPAHINSNAVLHGTSLDGIAGREAFMLLETIVAASCCSDAGVASAGFDCDGLETAGGAGETGVSSGIVILRPTGMLKPGSDKNW